MKPTKIELFNDHFQNYKRYQIPKAQLVIDPVAGSGSTLRACQELNRSCYGFEIKKNFYREAKEKMIISDENFKNHDDALEGQISLFEVI